MWLFRAYCTSRMKSITTSSFFYSSSTSNNSKKKCTCIYSTHIITYIKSCSKTSQTQHLNEKYLACNFNRKYSELLCQKMVADKCYTNVLYYIPITSSSMKSLLYNVVQYTMILCLVSLLYLACMGINILWILFNYENTCKIVILCNNARFPIELKSVGWFKVT